MLYSPEKPKINLFYRLIVLLGIIPLHCTITGNNGIFQQFYKLYIVFLNIIITLAATVTQICHFYILTEEVPHTTLIFTDSVQDITATICIIVTILAPTFLYPSSVEGLLENCKLTCKTSFIEEMLKITSSKRFAIQITVCHIILITIFAFDGYIWLVGYGPIKYTAFIFPKIQIYHNFVTILAIYVFVKFIRTQLEDTNRFLTEKLELRGLKGRRLNTPIMISPKCNNDQICTEIRLVTQYYENHVYQIALFNKLFGVQMLLLTLSFVTGLLNSINLIILFCFTNYETKLRAPLILTHVFWTLWQLVIGGLAVVMCTETEEVGRTTGDICLNALTNLPYSSENEELKEELILLNRLVNQKNPTFSAAGFFSINYSLLLSIIGSVTSYVIVLIQFDKV